MTGRNGTATAGSVMHANFQIRNGDPNGLPYRVAVDDRFLYVAYISHNGDGKVGSQWIQRFDRQTGKPERFPKGLPRNGLIQVYPPPEADSWDQPITGLRRHRQCAAGRRPPRQVA